MDEAGGMATNEQTGWKKRKTPNLAISNEASTASFYASGQLKRLQEPTGRKQRSRGSGPTSNYASSGCNNDDGLGDPHDGTKKWELCVAEQILWLFSETTPGNKKWQKSVRAGVQNNKRKTMDLHTRELAQKEEQLLGVCHLATQQSSRCGHTFCCAYH